MKHTFLLEEGLWKAKGMYFDDQNNEVPVKGETKIMHMNSTWIIEGFMRILSKEPIELTNRYEIEPIMNEADFTSWKSFNPALGRLTGKFMLIEDTIISTYVSESGSYSGSECLIQTSATEYISRGFAFCGDQKLSSWAVELKRVI